MGSLLFGNRVTTKDPGGTTISAGTQTLRFLGSVAVALVGNETQVTVGGGASIAVQQSGVPILSTGTLNFIGATVVNNAGVADITVTGTPPVGTANTVAFFNALGNLSSNTNLSYDETNANLGMTFGGTFDPNTFTTLALGGSASFTDVNRSILSVDVGTANWFESAFGWLDNITASNNIKRGFFAFSNSTVTGAISRGLIVGDDLVVTGGLFQQTVLGTGLITSKTHTIGLYNDNTDTDMESNAISIVGIGTSGVTRKTGHSITADGTTKVWKHACKSDAQTLGAAFTVTVNSSLVKVDSAADVTSAATPIAAPSKDGTFITLVNIGSFNITLTNGANFRCPNGINLTLTPNDTATFVYTNFTWYCVASSVN